MVAREEIVKTLATAFAVTIERWNDQNYPYQDTESLWEDHLQAANAIEEANAIKGRKIVLRHLQVLSSGRIVWHDVKTVWDAGKWVSGEHDPRSKDPLYREYLRLKEIYGDE